MKDLYNKISLWLLFQGHAYWEPAERNSVSEIWNRKNQIWGKRIWYCNTRMNTETALYISIVYIVADDDMFFPFRIRELYQPRGKRFLNLKKSSQSLDCQQIRHWRYVIISAWINNFWIFKKNFNWYGIVLEFWVLINTDPLWVLLLKWHNCKAYLTSAL